MPGRSFTSNSYKFGFNGQEKENDITDVEGGHLIFSARMHDARLGRFLSVDPLSSSYPWNSSYAFAENRVIDGVDLEGLEYLSSEESRIRYTSGGVVLKIENFSNPSQNQFHRANNNPKNWKEGEIGISRNIGPAFRFKLPDGTDFFGIDNTYDPADPMHNPARHKIAQPNTKQSNYTKRDERFKKGRTLGEPTSQFVRGTKGIIAVQILIKSLERFTKYLIDTDNEKLQEHYKLIRYVAYDILEALNQGLIPEEYQNEESIAAIANYVLQGENYTDDPNISAIGLEIFDKISTPGTVTPTTEPPAEGQDNTVIIKTPVIISNN